MKFLGIWIKREMRWFQVMEISQIRGLGVIKASKKLVCDVRKWLLHPKSMRLHLRGSSLRLRVSRFMKKEARSSNISHLLVEKRRSVILGI
jgi:hypothetical protein